MPPVLSPTDAAKYVAARRASLFVESGMRVGLGTGSTAAWLVRCLGRRVRDEGLRLTCVATSEQTARLAAEVGIAVVGLDEAGQLDLTIDGADEVDDRLDLIKGGGAALLREKIVAAASDRMIVIADVAKQVSALGAFPLPVEVVPFGWRTTRRMIEDVLGQHEVARRNVTERMRGESLLLTDQGNHILDLHLGRIADAARLGPALNQIPGVVENGLFIGICDTLVVGHPDGHVTIRDRTGLAQITEQITIDPADIGLTEQRG